MLDARRRTAIATARSTMLGDRNRRSQRGFDALVLRCDDVFRPALPSPGYGLESILRRCERRPSIRAPRSWVPVEGGVAGALGLPSSRCRLGNLDVITLARVR